MSYADLAVAAATLTSCYSLGWCLSLAHRLRCIERTSRLDPLTGLGSGDWLQAERWPAALRSGRPLGVVYLELDHLTLRNDLRGYLAGDAYIKTAAAAIGSACRRGVDEVFRAHTGGAAFVILLHGRLPAPAHLAAALLQRLRRRGVRMSLGVAYSTETRYLPSRVDLRIAAEAGCRQAKRCGGDCALVILEDAYGRIETMIRAEEARSNPPHAMADNVPTSIVDSSAVRLDVPQTTTTPTATLQP